MKLGKDKTQGLQVLAEIGGSNSSNVRILGSPNDVTITRRNLQVDAIVRIAHSNEQEFDTVLPGDEFFKLVKLSPGDEINLVGRSLQFSKMGWESEYGLDVTHAIVSASDHEPYVEAIQKTCDQRICLTDLPSLKWLRSFKGKDQYNFLALFDDVAIAFDQKVLAIAHTANKFRGEFLIVPAVLDLILKFAKESIDLAIYWEPASLGPFYHFRLRDADVFAPLPNVKTFGLPRDEVVKIESENFENAFQVRASRNPLQETLQRMRVVSRGNLRGRIFVTFEAERLLLESRDSNVSKEYVSAIVDEQLTGVTIALDCETLMRSIESLSSPQIHIYFQPGKTLVKIEDGSQSFELIQSLDRDPEKSNNPPINKQPSGQNK